MESKIRIKVGQVEVEFEGSEAFLKKELLDIVTKLSEIHSTNGDSNSTGITKEDGRRSGAVSLSTASIAAKSGCSGGQDLVVAAAAQLTFSQHADTFTRQQLLGQMKSARAYYKKSYSNNLTKYLDALVKSGKFNEPSTGTYSLSADASEDMEARIAS
jgi:hypothetical protein